LATLKIPGNPVKFVLSVFLLITCAVLLIIAVKRDLLYNTDYTGDLRNRVVGARLIQDGKSPYFYKWKAADGIRYYDPSGFGDSKVSNITASPFFHRLMIPVCNLPQSTLSGVWLCIEYFMFAVMLIIALSFCTETITKIAVCLIAVAFLFTAAWKEHILARQMYLVIPFLLSIFTCLFYKLKTGWVYFICGSVAISLVLIRPNFAVFFLPLLLLLKGFNIKNIALLFAPAFIAITIICSSAFERQLWAGYFGAIKIHASMHQGEPYEKINSEPSPAYAEWEGISLKNSTTLKPGMDIFPQSENGNFFIVFKLLTHKKITTVALLVWSTVIISGLFIIFIIMAKKIKFNKLDLRQLLILGFCFYMITDLFSPVIRQQCYTMQWLFAILIFFSIPKLKNGYWLVCLIVIGLLLNIIDVPFIKMRHTAGEYIILFSLLIFSLAYFKHKQFET
jgi:hypothetical protein